jgi:hypothetical protein
MSQFAALRSTVSMFLVDRCMITADAPPVFDPGTGEYTHPTGATVYTGPCRVTPTRGERVVVAGETTVTLRLFDVTLPWDTTGVEVHHLVTVTQSGDPHLTNRQLRVVDVQGMSEAAYRRLVCEETQ